MIGDYQPEGDCTMEIPDTWAALPLVRFLPPQPEVSNGVPLRAGQ
jgi:hypothetical protein